MNSLVKIGRAPGVENGKNPIPLNSCFIATVKAVCLLPVILFPFFLRAADFPAEKLPVFIQKLIDYGERPDFSRDGKRILFITRTGGEVEEIDIQTREIRRITCFARPDSVGFYRALYLANGDFLLTGGPARRKCVFYILDKSLTRPPTVISESVWEGPAVSRTHMRIAWTPDHTLIRIAEVVHRNGIPELSDIRTVLDNREIVVDGVRYHDLIEPQNFRPPVEQELIFSQYGEGAVFTSEVFGLNLKTGGIVNYSKAPSQYDEPEGIFPDGKWTLVECDKHNPKGTGFIDIYMLKLDGSGETRRLTYFSDVEGFRASNPVVRDDGRFMAFQEGRSADGPGVGHGIYLFDFRKAGIMVKP
jgi:hypothetical protein